MGRATRVLFALLLHWQIALVLAPAPVVFFFIYVMDSYKNALGRKAETTNKMYQRSLCQLRLGTNSGCRLKQKRLAKLRVKIPVLDITVLQLLSLDLVLYVPSVPRII